MSARSLTAADYREVLDGADWSPDIRDEFAWRAARAEKRETLLAGISERSRRDALTYKWQQETLRKLRMLHAVQFEIAAWRARERRPLWECEISNKTIQDVRGMRERFTRARREAAEGCQLQRDWLNRHAEIIAAVESAGR